MPPSLTVRLFGTFQVLVDGRPLGSLRTRKGEWLFALLALRHGRAVPREWLVEQLWPESESLSGGRDSLRKSLHDLRRALGPQATRLPVQGSQALCLDLTGADVDVITFAAAVRRGTAAALEAALDVYAGEFLPGCDEPWAVRERELHREAYLAALEAVASHAAARHDHRVAEGYLRRVVAEAPLRESGVRALMETLAVVREYAAAVAVYRDLRVRLRRERNGEPAETTRDLFRRLVDEAHAGGDGVTEVTATIPASGDHNLSSEGRPFIGREAECHDLVRKIRDRAERLVTVTSIGGMGKSRLSKQTALRLLEDFRDGVWMIECEELRDRAELAAAVAATLRLPVIEGRPEPALREALAGRNLLLVLDGFEALTAHATLVSDLLRAAPGVSCLVSSRVALGLPDEFEYPLAPMAYAMDQRGDPKDSLLLFADAAGHVTSDFRLTAANAGQVRQLCAELDGIPLAIILAAGRLRYLSLTELLGQVRQRRFDILRGRSWEEDRHASLLRVITDTLSALPPEERRLLRRLSIFVGGFFLDDAAAVCASSSWAEFFERVTVLCDRGLVEILSLTNRRRFRLLNTVREAVLGADAVAPEADEDLTDFREGHAQYCGRVAATLAASPWRDRRDLFWLETANLRAAIMYGAAHRRDELIAEMADNLARVFLEVGLEADFETLVQAADESYERLRRPDAQARLLGLRGALSRRRGQEEMAQRLWERRLRLCQEQGDALNLADSLLDLAVQARDIGDCETARRHLAQARRLARRGRFFSILTTAHAVGAEMALAANQPWVARRRVRMAMDLLINPIPDEDLLFIHLTLGRTSRALGNESRAQASFLTMIRLGLESERTAATGWALLEWGKLLEGRGETTQAARLFRAAQAIEAELSVRLRRELEEAYERVSHESHDPPGDVFLGRDTGRGWRQIVSQAIKAIGVHERSSDHERSSGQISGSVAPQTLPDIVKSD